jgi:hypothetical protein
MSAATSGPRSGAIYPSRRSAFETAGESLVLEWLVLSSMASEELPHQFDELPLGVTTSVLDEIRHVRVQRPVLRCAVRLNGDAGA